MKKTILFLITLIFAADLALAHGPRHRFSDSKFSESWTQMEKWHNVMHGISVKSETIDDGIQLSITVEDTATLETLKTDFKINESSLSTYFKNTVITLEELNNGFDIRLVAENDELEKRLQSSGSRLFFWFLRDQVHDFAYEDSKYGFGRGCGGYGAGRRGWGGRSSSLRGFGPVM